MRTLELDVTFTPRDEKDETETLAALESGGAKEVRRLEERGLTGVEIALIAIVSVNALVSVIARLSRQWRAGVIVDARGSKVRTTRDPGLPGGVVIVVEKDGTKHQLHEPQDKDLTSILVRLAGGD
jgi:hypothetical protein